jgi:predicted kinase
MSVLKVPELALVVLAGVSGSGKTTFAQRHFKATEVLSSDSCRALVSDDENDQNATNDAFDVLRYIAGKRLAAGRLTVVDATNVNPESRASFVALAQLFDGCSRLIHEIESMARPIDDSALDGPVTWRTPSTQDSTLCARKAAGGDASPASSQAA